MPPGLGDQARADQDVVAARAELDPQSTVAAHGRRLTTRRAGAPGPVARKLVERVDDPLQRRLRRTVGAVDGDVGLGIDRVALRSSARPASGAARPPAAAAGRCGARRGAAADRDRRAARRRSPARAISARVRGSMKAPPPVASTWSRIVEQPGDDAALAVAESRLAVALRRSRRWSIPPRCSIS